MNVFTHVYTLVHETYEQAKQRSKKGKINSDEVMGKSRDITEFRCQARATAAKNETPKSQKPNNKG